MSPASPVATMLHLRAAQAGRPCRRSGKVLMRLSRRADRFVAAGRLVRYGPEMNPALAAGDGCYGPLQASMQFLSTPAMASRRASPNISPYALTEIAISAPPGSSEGIATPMPPSLGK